MNLKAITSALLIAGLAAPSAFASTGTVTFTGSITNVTCTVDGGAPGNGPDFTVNIGAVNAADFANVGDTSGNTGYRIYIGKAGETTCADGTKVWASYDTGSTVDPATGALKTVGAATGVQIRLFDKNGQPIDIWNDKQDSVKEVVVGNQALLAYSASYQRTGNITAGDANSSVTYTVRFEN
ncbi:MAG: fimbrial protein [Luteibacter sp.]|uniref:fimbrial protein n=1 Tax=unclassified Luteibacter TaxID=2620188 RepID=UPI0028086F60|nr:MULTISPECIES: fimbrial protein [unclassified Luteibacter]MDQ7995894.1 fimbrial protein [Luteibacter sp.]MDQ8049182.1 fimbrial protein [Luteibacter sp.]MDR6642311.1 major type 1 subunit fimbrin (pilin) [Luteibacter sp. 1214]